MADVKVSVIVPCYNSQGTIFRAINSVLTGSVLPFEILIYDDNSNDKTIETIEENFSSNCLVKLFRGFENKGAGFARSDLLRRANGNFIAFLDSDDWWYYDKLEKQIQRILTDNCDIVTCGYHVFDENNRLIGKRTPILKVNFFTLHLTNWLPTSMTIFRKNLLQAHEMPSIRTRQDYAFWLKIFKANGQIKCCVIEQPLGGYLRRSNSLSSGGIKNLMYNYYMFRGIMQYNWAFSIFLVLLNSAIRILRK